MPMAMAISAIEVSRLTFAVVALEDIKGKFFCFCRIYLAIGSLDGAGSARALSPSSTLPLSTPVTTASSVTPVPASLVPEAVDERKKEEEEEETSGSKHILPAAFRGNSVWEQQ